MKRYVCSMLAIAMLAVAMFGCAAKPASSGSPDAQATSASATEVPKATNKLDEILANGKITMAVSPDFPPLEFMDLEKTGQEAYVGSDIALGKFIAEQLGVELVIEAMDFTAVQAAVTQGKVDMAISGFAYTDERAESMELSDFYNVQNDDGQGLLVLAANADSYKDAAAFSGKKVAAQNSSLQYNLVTAQLPDAVIEPITNLNDAVMMLISGKVDAVAVSGDNGKMFAENYSEIVMAEFMFDYSSEGNVIGITKGETELLEKINEIIKKVNDENLYPGWYDEAIAIATELGVEI